MSSIIDKAIDEASVLSYSDREEIVDEERKELERQTLIRTIEDQELDDLKRWTKFSSDNGDSKKLEEPELFQESSPYAGFAKTVNTESDPLRMKKALDDSALWIEIRDALAKRASGSNRKTQKKKAKRKDYIDPEAQIFSPKEAFNA